MQPSSSSAGSGFSGDLSGYTPVRPPRWKRGRKKRPSKVAFQRRVGFFRGHVATYATTDEVPEFLEEDPPDLPEPPAWEPPPPDTTVHVYSEEVEVSGGVVERHVVSERLQPYADLEHEDLERRSDCTPKTQATKRS